MKKKWILFFLNSIFLCFIYAQPEEQIDILKQTTSKIDSLKAIYNHPDSSALSKINALGFLFNQYLYNDQDSAKHYLARLKEIADEHSLKKGQARHDYFKGILFDLSGQLDSSFMYYNQAYAGYKEINDTLQITRTLVNLANIDYQQGKYQQAIDTLQRSINMCLKAFGEEHAELGTMYGLIGNIYSEQAYNQLALQNLLTSLAYHVKSGDQIRKADVLTMLGNVELNLGNYENIIPYNVEAISIYKEYNDVYYQAESNGDIGNAYIELQQYEKAGPYLTEGLALAKQMDAKSLEGKIYAYQSKIATARNEDDLALQLLNKGLAIHREIGNPSEVARSLQRIGYNYLQNNQSQLALPYFNQIIKMADTIDIIDELHDALYNRSTVYENLNQLPLALDDLKKYHILHDTFLNKVSIQKIEELRIMHDTENKEREIVLQDNQISLLEKEATVSQLQRTLLGGGLGLSFVIFGLVYYGIRQQLKRKRLEHQHAIKEKEIVEKEKELETQKRESAEQQLEFKKKELTAKVLQLAKKNEFLHELETEIVELQSSVDVSVGKASSRISRMIQRDAVDDEEWEQFAAEFSSVHQEFLDRLREQFGTFSKGEMRLIYLLRMNMTSKEIANILRISGEGIRKARYRLRKKMKLDSSEDLQGIILGL